MVVASTLNPHECRIAYVMPVAMAPPSGTVLDTAAAERFATPAWGRRRPGRLTQIGGQFDTRLSSPKANVVASAAGVM
jgi:hypothetical protein